MEMFSEYASIILMTVIQFLIAVGGIAAIRLITVAFKKLGIEIDKEMMNDIENIVFKAVNVTNQTLADAWRAANPDHCLTDEQKALAYENTKKIVMASLSSEQLQALAAKYGVDAEEAIKLLIENSVYWSGDNATATAVASLARIC